MINSILRLTALYNIRYGVIVASFFGIMILTSYKNSDTLNLPNRIRDFDKGWHFIKDSTINASQVNYDDSKWRILDLPHDWSIEDLPQQVPGVIVGPFSRESAGGASTGNTIGGTGWYRNTFSLTNTEIDKRVSIYIEGAYMETDVWVNGSHVGEHKHGYTSFYFDITKFCNPAGEQNIIAIRVTNNGKNSRWYSGSGLYRHVKLIVTDPIHVDQWGVFITTPKVSVQSATVKVNTKISNEINKAVTATIKTRLFDALNKQVAQATTVKSIQANGNINLLQAINLEMPKLWSLQTPDLYSAEVCVFVGDKLKDITITQFGIRTITITPEKGFLLNGKPVKLHGGCIHHDNGILGAAAIDRAEERRIELLKANGFNAIRCSHNQPSEKFLETCDRLGMLIIDETFDQWQKPKNPDDYHRFFDEWWDKDFSSMIMRDRNHPSVMLWSLGNEIEERADSSGIEITKKLTAKVKALDSSRLTTEAVCEFWDHPGREWPATAPAFALLDVSGYNYQWWQYENDHKNFPKRIMMGTESVPKHAFQNWDLVEKHPYVIGDFVWTAMDYLGESGIGHSSYDTAKDSQLKPWPWFNGNCGDIDLIGMKKPQSYYRDVVWRRSKIEMAVHKPYEKSRPELVSYWGWPDEEQSWTWPGNDGKMMEVNVYARASIVRLLLNGKLIGEKALDSLLTAKFELPYSPGELKAVAINNGKETDSVTLRTTGSPKSIRLVADRQTIQANRNDLSFITAEIIDEKGQIIPYANIPIQFSISGNGELAGIGNANPADMASFKQLERNTFKGRCLVILRPKNDEGTIVLEAKAEGLQSAKIVITTKQ